MEADMMKIIVSNLAEGEHKYEFKETVEYLELIDLKAKDGINVYVTLDKSDMQIHAIIKVSSVLIFPCDRCTDDFEFALDTEFDVVFKYSKSDVELKSTDNDNIFFISPETNNIDLKQVVRENILISLPMRHVPEETDGICSFCKKDINEILRIEIKQELNPVWNKLLNKN